MRGSPTDILVLQVKSSIICAVCIKMLNTSTCKRICVRIYIQCIMYVYVCKYVYVCNSDNECVCNGLLLYKIFYIYLMFTAGQE